MGWTDKSFVVHRLICIMCVSSVNLWCGSYLGPAVAVGGGVLLVF